MNVNIAYSLVLAIEGIIIIILLLRLLFKKNRTKGNYKRSFVHIAGIVSIFAVIGHFVSVLTLRLSHHETIEVFRKHKEQIPIADRVNGAWILNEKGFEISDSERRTLAENYDKSVPCKYQDGYCYFELGGFLKNSGGYFYNLNYGKPDPGSFGFHRINQVVELVGSWGFYN